VAGARAQVPSPFLDAAGYHDASQSLRDVEVKKIEENGCYGI
jgi:hypothetical protein